MEPVTSKTISVTVNGASYEREIDVRRLFVHFIRDELDLTGMKASFGLDPSVEGVTYRELQQRREIIRERLQKHDRKAAKHK